VLLTRNQEHSMTTFALRIRPRVRAELDAATAAESFGHFDTAFRHLERAHVLGQPATREHVRVHWRMLLFALRHDRTADALGQAWRLVGAALLTAVGLVPIGNAGGSNVNGLRRMPIAPDLRRDPDAGDFRDELDVEAAEAPARCRRGTAATALLASLAALASIAACSTPPANLDLSLDRVTAAGTYRVALVPPATMPAINQMHSWNVRLASPDGTPVHGATFAVDGGMPQHGHGLPTQPRVTRELADGTYVLEGMKFSMSGWWEVKLAISGPLGSDRVTFNTVVSPPAAQP
jgi:hypothetical protein